MAKRAGDDTENVVSLEAKRGRKAKPTAGGYQAPASPAIGHNNGPITEEGFFSWVGKITRQQAEVDKARAAHDGEKDVLKQIRKEAGAAGIKLGILDAKLKLSKTSRVDLIKELDVDRQYAIWLGLPVGTQGKLDLGADAPSERPKDDKFWRESGYQAGVAGLDRDYPAEGPPEHKADFEHGWGDGQAKLGMRLKKGRSPSKGKDQPALEAPSKLPDSLPKETVGEALNSFETTEEELAQQIGRRKPDDEEIFGGGDPA